MSNIVKAGPGLHVGDYYAAETIDRDRVISKNPNVIEGYRLNKIRVAGKDMLQGAELKAHACACDDKVDISWLPYCADKYQISADARDFFLVSIPLIVSSLPNRNMDAFPFDELTAWRTVQGTTGALSWRGKPVHRDHDNQDDSKALGVIFDVTLRPFRDHWAVVMLEGFDRTKNAKIAEQVRQQKRLGHSMGCLVERTECSVPSCRFVSDGVTTCQHIAGGAGKGQIIRQGLVYELLRDFIGVESSTVLDPAWLCALSEQFIDF